MKRVFSFQIGAVGRASNRALGVAGLACLALWAFTGCRRPALTESPRADAPERVVSLAPNLTEMLAAIGEGRLLVGRSSACDYPPDLVRTIPVVGGFGKPSMEALARLHPTLIVDAALEDETLGRRLEELGIRRARIACRFLDDIPPAIRELGRLVKAEARADALAGSLGERLGALRRQAREAAASGRPPPRVFVEIWDDPIMTAGKQSFLSELIALAGGINLGDEADREYFRVSSEWVMTRNPEVILCLYQGPASAALPRVAARPGWGACAAVVSRRVYGGLDLNLVLRPGPRVAEGVEALRACLHE